MSAPGIEVPKSYTIPPGSSGIQVPAAGGSIINFQPVTVYLVANQEDIGNTNIAAPLVQGAALPWPSSQTCYAFVTGNTPGMLYISPIQSSVFPVPTIVTIGGQPIQVDVDNAVTVNGTVNVGNKVTVEVDNVTTQSAAQATAQSLSGSGSFGSQTLATPHNITLCKADVSFNVSSLTGTGVAYLEVVGALSLNPFVGPIQLANQSDYNNSPGNLVSPTFVGGESLEVIWGILGATAAVISFAVTVAWR